MKPHRLETLISSQEIQTKVSLLASQINQCFSKDEPLVLIGLMRGALMFMADLAKQLTGNVILDVMCVSSYGNNLTSSNNLIIYKDLQVDIKNCNVLLVDDMVDTGNTMFFLKEKLLELNPKKLSLCVLLSKPCCLNVELDVDFVGFEIENDFVVGYGIDYAEHYRNLPEIAKVVLLHD